MKTIEIDDEVYLYIASQTKHIGESASTILRRLLDIKPSDTLSVSEADKLSSERDFSLIYELIENNKFKQQRTRVNRFLSILSLLYQWNNTQFSLASLSLLGRKRRYLATSKSLLDQCGSNTRPKAVSGTPFWVVTNSNTPRKCQIITLIMDKMAFPQHVIEDVVEHFVANE